MTEAITVLGAAIVRVHKLFVARRSQPPSLAGYWELPGAELAGDERGTLTDLFTKEFGVGLDPADQLLGDRMLMSWRDANDDPVPANLRVWRCQFPVEFVFDTDLADPRPNMYRYDDVAWVPVEELDAVGPWRDEMRIAAGEAADWYQSDPVWQAAD